MRRPIPTARQNVHKSKSWLLNSAHLTVVRLATTQTHQEHHQRVSGLQERRPIKSSNYFAIAKAQTIKSYAGLARESCARVLSYVLRGASRRGRKCVVLKLSMSAVLGPGCG